MIPLFGSRRPAGKASRHRNACLALEGLEERLLLYATNGGEWVFPQRVTYSFVPDGTSVGGVPSSLSRTMNATMSTAAWQAAIKRAAAIWETVANVQLAQVPDDGAPIGSSGDQQGDPNFGDIRIGAIPEQGGNLAMTFLPPPLNGGTLAGDIFFNSSANWNPTTGYDLDSVAIHEFGHALGMDHSQIQQAVMYSMYTGVKQTFNSDDVAGIQSIYGGVPADPVSNGQMSLATNITGMINDDGQVALAGQAISGATDQDYFKVTVPSGTTGSMTVSVQATSLSSLAPRLTLFNGSGQGIAQVSNTNGYGTTATLTLANVSPGQIYYIRAIAANTGPGSVGAYGLLVNFGPDDQAPIPPPDTTVASQSSTTSSSSSAETAGPSALSLNAVGGIVTGAGGTVATIVGNVIQVGNLSGYGDALTASPARHADAVPEAVQPRHAALQLGAITIDGVPHPKAHSTRPWAMHLAHRDHRLP